jgi:fimbrial isopeptide formation D2 family protein/LPXTG-motif cell wall-anchored protein
MKKLIALVLALALVFAVAVASAATITINRDSSWRAAVESGESASATYTPYKVFDAVITTAATVDAASGTLTSEGNVVYTVDSANKAAAVNATTVLKAEKGSDDKYYISKVGTPTDAAILNAIETMVLGNTALFPAGTPVTSDANPVTLTVADNGYYYISASNGKDAMVQTIGSVTINEKNDYPTIDKKQKKANGTYADTALPAEIGTYIDYQVTVHVPNDATKAIYVFDKMSAGLEFDVPENTDGLTVTPATATYSAVANSDGNYDANATWQIKFDDSVVETLRGHDIVITYRALITEAAISDAGKENEVTLKYDNNNYIKKDDVDYEIYFGGIYKVDPNQADADMSGVKFVLKDDTGTAVNVSYDSTNGYYRVNPSSSSNEVETRAETATIDSVDKTFYTIKIRGLDNDKTYTLTETETKAGYNLLNGTVTLTKTKDEGQAFDNKALNTFDRVVNNKGTQLPSTGGIGTTIFYIVGGMLLVGAAIVLVARRKASN